MSEINDPLRTLAIWVHTLNGSYVEYAKAISTDSGHAEAYIAARVAAEDDARRSIVEADGWNEVYFLQESGMNAIKIGVTSNLKGRLGSMQPNTPHEIKLLGRVHADVRLESFLKDCFSHVRIRGEWFRPIPELMQYIATLPPFDKNRCLPALFEKRLSMRVIA